MFSKRTLDINLFQNGYRHFGRTLNRAHRMNVDSRTDMTAYDYQPEHITKIEPSPRYLEKGLKESLGREKIKRDHVYNAERLRTAGILKRSNMERIYQGRLYTHLKLNEMKQSV